MRELSTPRGTGEGSFTGRRVDGARSRVLRTRRLTFGHGTESAVCTRNVRGLAIDPSTLEKQRRVESSRARGSWRRKSGSTKKGASPTTVHRCFAIGRGHHCHVTHGGGWSTLRNLGQGVGTPSAGWVTRVERLEKPRFHAKLRSRVLLFREGPRPRGETRRERENEGEIERESERERERESSWKRGRTQAQPAVVLTSTR